MIYQDKKSRMQVLDEIIELRGVDQQLVKACEELAELIQAITKYLGVKSDEKDINKPSSKIIGARDNIIEEIVDTSIMIEQVKKIIRTTDSELNLIREFKIKRLKERISNVKKNV